MRSKSQCTTLTQQISQIQSLLQEGKIIEAEHQARNLLQATPNNEELYLLTAKVCQALGKAEASVTHLTNLLKLNQHHAEANKLLANHYFNSSTFEAALTHINAALAQSTSPETQELKGLILAGLHEYDKAIETFLKVVDSEQASWLTWNNLANQYRNLGLFKEAQECYLKAIELSGFDDTPYNNLITFLHYLPESKKNELKSLYKNWEEKYSRNISATKHQADRALKNKKIRIGMISDGFRTHPVGQMITSALEALPENEIELYAYSTNNAEDQLTYRTKKASEKWMSVAHLSEEKLAQEFINDKIDILFDLCGHNNGCRMRTMAMKPAPILVKWVGGLINTTGLSTMDYLLSDSIETPAGEDEFYTEKLIRMPDDYICYDAPIYTPDIYSPPAKRNDYITLGCFNNPTKLNYVLLGEWAKIMHSLPDSRLFLKGFQFSSKVLRENIRNQLKDLGITENRVLIEGPSHHEELLKSYNKVDIALDTWPYSGGLTTCEAMYMGVPVVTYPGPTFAGRHSATHLTNAGMPQLVAESWEHYHDLVVMLASDIDNLANIRQHLRGALLESPVCNAKRFARNFSNAMRAIWQRHCEVKQPAALTLDKEGNAQFEDEAEPVQLQLPEEPVLVEDDDFHFRFNGKIVVVDHGAGFTCSESFHTLHKLGAIKTLCIDPGSRIRNAQQLTNTGDFHHFPLTVLGDGSEMELALAVEAERSTTLPIIAPDPNAIIPEQEPPALISTTKVTSNRIDDIDGLEHIDWLILDDQHHNLSILEHGSKKLANALLIEVCVSFSFETPRNNNFNKVTELMDKLGFRLFNLDKLEHSKFFPAFSENEEKISIKSGKALFLPNNYKLLSFDANKLKKLAFLLDSVHHQKGAVYHLLNNINPNIAEQYIRSLRNNNENNETDIDKIINNLLSNPLSKKGKKHLLKKPLVISLTSYEKRFSTLHLTIRSLLSQTVEPDHLVLWIAKEEKALLPKDVTDLQDKGLEIKFCEDIKSYKKIIPTINKYPNSFIATADDDVYYPQEWLETLIDVYNENEKCIPAHRIHRIQLDNKDIPLPYQNWMWEYKNDFNPHPLNFPTGMGGVLYPPSCFHKDVTNENLFINLCPKGDDIWLYTMATIAGYTFKPTKEKLNFTTWPSTQSVALHHENIKAGNDEQLKKIINHYHIFRPHLHKITYNNKLLKLHLPDNDDHIQKIIRTSNTFYEIDMLKSMDTFLAENSTFIDIGANIGNHTIYAAIKNNVKTVYSFEPQPYVFNTLHKNICNNNLQRKVRAFNIGLSNKSGHIAMGDIDPNNLGMTKLNPNENGDIKVQRLDDIVKKEDYVSIIKIDVEGMECCVLEGAKETIIKNAPAIYIEATTQKEKEKIEEILKPLGYYEIKKFNATPTYLYLKP
ncbi:FkbM family methyltransferase [Oceanimonas sp. AH20CE76]|uniref:FkbM family methyltransferase n=1 Tax=Oceanimonas sp. AH20CE76 TaxID=2977120 RepID=UPI0031FF091E